MYKQAAILRNKQGALQLYTNRTWKDYLFKITGNMYLHYFKLKKLGTSSSPIEQIFLSNIVSVTAPLRYPKGGQFVFQVKHSGKSSPWMISTRSYEEQIEWMEAILPGSTQSGIKRKAPLLANKAQSISITDLSNAIQTHQHLAIETPGSPLIHQSCSLTNLSQCANAKSIDFNSKSSPQTESIRNGFRAESSLSLKQISTEEEETDEYVEPGSNRGDSRSTSTDNDSGYITVLGSNHSSPAYMMNIHTGVCDVRRPETDYPQNENGRDLENKSANEEYMDMSGMDIAPPSQSDDTNKEVYDYVDTKKFFKIKLGPCKTHLPNKKPCLHTKANTYVRPDSCPINVDSVNDGSTRVLQEFQQKFTKDQISSLTQILWKLQVRSGTGMSPTKDLSQLVSVTTEKLSDSVLVAEKSKWARAECEEILGSCPVLPSYPDTHDVIGTCSISCHSLTNLAMIGAGQFGEVYNALYTPEGSSSGKAIPVAVKTVSIDYSEEQKQDFLREMAVMSKMTHPNIVRLHGIVTENVSSHWIVLEYLPYDDLKSCLCKSEKKSHDTLLKYMVDVAMGMHHLAENGLIHRSLAACNVLVGQEGLCKVANVGLLRRMPQVDSGVYQNTSDVSCSVRWAAPETLSEEKFSMASDIWSYGILLWEMLQPNKTPYEPMDDFQVVTQVIKGYRMPIPRGCPPVIARVMKACVHANPAKRPSFLVIVSLLTTKLASYGNSII